MKKNINRRDFLKVVGVGAASLAMAGCLGDSQDVTDRAGNANKPNFIIIFCDDLGYGDLGCFGSKKHRTPNIDRMANEGMRFTSFYVTSGVCTPSRASLMTGCYPRRVDLHQDSVGGCVLFPVARKGLNPKEITIAEILKQAGYATACIGKWHLGDQPEFLPRRHGFDYYFGLPYSNDMGPEMRQMPPRMNMNNPPVPLLRNEKVIEAPVEQTTLTRRYTEEAIKFIRANKDRPFFLYLPHTMPHHPAHASAAFSGKSANGSFGDAVEEIDFSTGRILAMLAKLGIDNHTLVVFASDNGASHHGGGSNAPLASWKGSTMEGGMRSPTIMRWPGRIGAGGTSDELASTMDLLPTFARLAGTGPPRDRIIDGKDIRPLIFGEKGAKSPHEAFYYYFREQLQAVRSGRWKLHLPLAERQYNFRGDSRKSPMRLYDLDADIAETTNVADDHPDIVKHLLALAEKAREDIGDGRRKGKNQRPAGLVTNPKPLTISLK